MPSDSNQSLEKGGVNTNLQHSLFQMPSKLSPTAIPYYRKVLLDEIETSRVILSFDPLEFELKAFFWYVFFVLTITQAYGSRPGLWKAANA
jgi:hypothetical protein